MLGTDVNPGVHVRELTSDSIRHFASASGDDNPLWCDPHHAHAAGYPAVLAPPMIVFAHSLGPAIAGLRDMTASGSSWGLEFHRRLYCGETLQSRARLIGVAPRNGPGEMGASFELEIWNQDLDLLVTMRGTTGAPSATGLHQVRGAAGASPPRYTQAELAAIERAVRSERRRGAEALQVNPPRPGEQIGPIVKGPLVLGDFVHWYGACGPDCLAGPTSRERAISSIEPGETERLAALSRRPFSGPGMAAWFAHLITNWMGDEAFLREFDLRLEAPVFLGDTVWCRGEVEDVTVEQEQPAGATCRLWGVNQLGSVVATGCATIDWR